MWHAAHRHDEARYEGGGLRQPSKPRRDPAAVLVGEFARLLERAARRDRQDDFARRRLDAQRVAARPAKPAEQYEIDGVIEGDFDGKRLGSATIKERMQRHCGASRILIRRRILPHPIHEWRDYASRVYRSHSLQRGCLASAARAQAVL